jgi:hypothetical protein
VLRNVRGSESETFHKLHHQIAIIIKKQRQKQETLGKQDKHKLHRIIRHMTEEHCLTVTIQNERLGKDEAERIKWKNKWDHISF